VISPTSDFLVIASLSSDLPQFIHQSGAKLHANLIKEKEVLMAKKKSDTSITIGNISGVSGEVNVAGGDIYIKKTTGLSAEDFGKLFEQLNATIDARPNTPPADKADLKAEVQEIHEAVKKAGEEQKPPDESFLARHFRNIARMAPDILDVVVATLGNPLAGLGVAVKKIAEKAKGGTAGT
jgi:hypothetical protein